MRSAISSSLAIAVATYNTGSPHSAARRSANWLLPERAPPSTSTRRKVTSLIAGKHLEGDGSGADAQSLGGNDRLEIANRLIESIAIIDDHVVILAQALHLAFGGSQPNAALFGSLGPTRREPRFQLLQ